MRKAEDESLAPASPLKGDVTAVAPEDAGHLGSSSPGWFRAQTDWSWLVCLAMLGLALFSLLHPMLSSGLRRIPGDLGDARLDNYILEHSFLWVAGRPDHSSFWDPPVFYPERNVAANAETLLGAAPLYWLWRAARASPETAFQLWQLTVAALNFLAARALLRRGLGSSEVAADIGAFLFCAGAARAREIGHPQLMPQFYSLLALYAMVRLGEEPTPRRPGLWWLAGTAALVLQLWASFYLAWFLVLGLAALALWGLAASGPRRDMARVVRRDWRWAALCSLLGAAAIWPLVAHSRQAAAVLGWRPFAQTLPMMPEGMSWLAMGPGSWLFQGTRFAAPGEVAVGLGWVTLCLALAGFWLARRRSWAPPVLAASFTLAVLATRFPGGVTAWPLLLPWFPGGAAIRAVWRVALILLVPCTVGVAIAVDRVRRRRPAAAAILALACLLEQAYTSPSYLKEVARRRALRVAAQISPGCRAFRAVVVARSPEEASNFASITYNLDAMFAQLLAGIPTSNGYGAQGVILPGDEEHYSAHLRAQFERQGLRPAEVCVVMLRGGSP